MITAGFGTDRLPAARRRPGAPGRTRTPRARGVGTAQGAGSPARSPSRRTRKRPGADAGAKAGASTPPAPPPAPSAPSSSAPSRPIKQWRGRTGHPPQTNPPSSTQRASSSTQSSPGALMRRALAAVSSRCSPHGDRRGRRAVLLEWTGGGRQGRSGVPHSGVVVWRSALLLGMDAVAVQSDSGACVRGCGGCVWFVGGAPGCFVCCAAGSSRRCVTAPLSARPRRVVLCRTA